MCVHTARFFFSPLKEDNIPIPHLYPRCPDPLFEPKKKTWTQRLKTKAWNNTRRSSVWQNRTFVQFSRGAMESPIAANRGSRDNLISGRDGTIFAVLSHKRCNIFMSPPPPPTSNLDFISPHETLMRPPPVFSDVVCASTV